VTAATAAGRFVSQKGPRTDLREVEQERSPTAQVRALGWIVSTVARILLATYRMTAEGEERAEALRREHGGLILATWHGRSLVPIARMRGRGYVGIVSLSRDGDLISQCLRRLGWRVIRGSTGRRGATAAKAIIAALGLPGAGEGTVLAVTPDGPRGPSRVAQPGVAYLAAKTGKPIVPVGIGADRAWRARSWDAYLVPRPFARVLWLYGDPIFVGPGDDPDEVLRRVESAIDATEAEAESRAALPRADVSAGSVRRQP